MNKREEDLVNSIFDEILINCEGCMRKSSKCIEEECVLFRIEKIIEDWRMKNE